MSDYLVLARKYRSATFEEVVGQEPISTTLVNAVKTGRIAQAFLFTGTRGVGKTTMARILAKALNCMSAEEPTAVPCNACNACDAIGRGDDMDVIEIDGASNRGIDEIRQLRNNAALRPARCRYKVYYIDEVHMLTKEAFNALLKTLEEPPPHVKFIFATTEAEKIPATILSRCQRFDFRNISTADIAGHLGRICKAEKVDISDDAIFRVAKAAAGSMRDGISLLDQLISSASGPLAETDVLRVLGTPPDERIAAVLTAVVESDAAAALEALDDILAAGYPLEGIAAALADQFRNVMLALTCGSDSRLIELAEGARKSLAEAAGRFTVPSAVHAVGVCEQLMRNLRGSSCGRALAEAAVVRLAASDKFVDPTSLVQRLEQLAAGSTAATAPGKKKPLTARPAPAETASRHPENASGAVKAAAAVQWEVGWLTDRWDGLMRTLGEMGFAAEAGLLRVARPLGAETGLIRLGYAADMEGIRTQAAGPMARRLAMAMEVLAGGTVRCECVSTGEKVGPAAAIPARPSVQISSEQKQQLLSDPTVKEVLGLFGGEMTGVRPDPAAQATDDAGDA